MRSGWGDGYYAIVGGYDASDRLLAVHVDFFLFPAWAEPGRGSQGAYGCSPCLAASGPVRRELLTGPQTRPAPCSWRSCVSAITG